MLSIHHICMLLSLPTDPLLARRVSDNWHADRIYKA
jgi:hypothetical protein